MSNPSTRRVWCGLVVGLLALCLGCSGKSTPDLTSQRARPAAESRLLRKINVSAIHVLPGGQVAAVVSGDREGLVVSPDGVSGWARRNPTRGESKNNRPLQSEPILSVAWQAGALWGLTSTGVMRSDDLGKTWRDHAAGGPTMRYLLLASSSELWSAERSGKLNAITSTRRLSDARVVTALLELPEKQLLVTSFGKGIFRSSDAGATWLPSNQGLENLDATSLATLGGNKVLAGLFGAGVVRSEDGGASWTGSSQGLEDTEIQALAYDGAGTALAGAQRGLFRSTDQGRTWTRVGGPVGRDNVQAVAFDAKGAALVGTWGNGMLRSADRGLSWEGLSISGEDDDFYALTLTRDGSLLAGTRAGRVYSLAEDGSSWAQLGDRVGNLEILQVVRSPRGSTFAGTSAGLYRLTPSVTKWEAVDLPSGRAPAGRIAMAEDGTIFLGASTTSSEGLWTSSDDGRTWTARKDACLQGRVVSRLSANANGSVIVASCYCLSRDGGRTWTAQDSVEAGYGIPSGEICLTDINGVDVAAVGSNNYSGVGLYFGSSGPGLQSTASWDVDRLPSCMAVAPGGEVFLADRASVQVVRPGAKKPEKRASGDFECRRLLVSPKGALLMASEVGLRRSNDGGRTWARMDGLAPPQPRKEAMTPDAGGER